MPGRGDEPSAGVGYDDASRKGRAGEEAPSGLGFMYLCLLHCRGNVEQTLNLLLDQQLPPVLQHVEQSLSLQGGKRLDIR